MANRKQLSSGIHCAFVMMLTANWASAQPTQPAAGSADRTRMMEILHIPQPGPFPPVTEDPKRPQGITQNPQRPNLWSDAEGKNFQRSSWGTWSNYDEAKAGGYTLPDPLVLKNGQPVKDAQTWWKQRRPEILNDFLTEIYGKIPQNTPKVTWEVTATDANAANGTAIMKTVVGRIDNSEFPSANPSINITMYTPSKATGAVPMIVVVGPGAAPGGARRGAGTQPAAAPAGARGPGGGANSPMSQLLAIGWGYATVATGAIQADNGAGLSSGIIGLTAEGKPRKPDDWGVLSAWAWGMSRAMDYFETDKSVDAKQLGIEGHSRWGKEALWTAALDQRWAIVWPSCSGEGGASLAMRAWGESLDDVAGAGEYHWMAGNYLKYGGNWNKLPVDAHELIALVAPRPVFVTGGTGDQWADPHGEFLACVGAAPVYRLLGKKDMGTTEMPKPDVSLISGDLAFRFHEGGHTDTIDWPVFLEFAQKHLKTAAVH